MGSGLTWEVDSRLSKAFALLRASREPHPRPRGNTDGHKALSPLRYPGSKRQLVPVVREAVYASCDSPPLFVEPFAGGASVALQLAHEGVVNSIVLGDADELIYSFWMVAAYDTPWLIDSIFDVEVSIRQWEKFKQWAPTDRRDQALKCLFLNRTNFSGILHDNAGPIGGPDQRSPYSIDCRFPRETLAHRVQNIGALAQVGRVAAIVHGDWRETIRTAARLRRTRPRFYFLDPPFYGKGASLYRHSFTTQQHLSFSKHLARLRAPWLLSYDDHPEVRALYIGRPPSGMRLIQTEYQVATRSKQAHELLLTNVSIEGNVSK